MAENRPLGSATNIFREVTIASGASVSGAADLGRGVLIGWLNPSALTNSAFTVQGTVDGTNYYNIAALTGISATVDTFSSVPPADSKGWHKIKLKGASNEAADRTIVLVYEDIR